MNTRLFSKSWKNKFEGHCSFALFFGRFTNSSWVRTQARRLRYFGTAWLLFQAVLLQAQIPQEFAIDNWQVEDGLPDNTVSSIAQTADGYLWVGTFTGLCRFDGIRFVVFDSRTPGLQSQRIVKIFNDGEGLWISMEGGHLARYANGRFTPFGKEEGWVMELCKNIFKTKSQEIFFLAKGGDLVQFKNGRFVKVLVETPGLEAALGTESTDDSIAWGKREGVLGLVKGGKWAEFRPLNKQLHPNIKQITSGYNGGLWAFGGTNLYRISGPEKEILTVPYPTFMDPSLLEEDRTGHLWIGTWGQGLVDLIPGGAWRRYWTANGFPNNTIRCFFQDQEGNLWIGTNGGGLVRLRARAFRTYGRKEGLPPLHPQTLAQDALGRVWIGLLDGGLCQFKRDKILPPIEMQKGRVIGPTIWSTLTDSSGRLLLGTYGEGILGQEAGGTNFYSVIPTLTNGEVFALCEDKKKNLWIGTSLGLVRFDGTNCTYYTTQNGLLANEVRALAEDNAGNLWIGTLESGLNLLNNQRLTGLTREQGLSHNSVRTLFPDTDGSLWIGTAGGLCWFREGRLISLSKRHGLPAEDIVSILDDEMGFIWCGSNRGIFRIARTELEGYARGEKPEVECAVYGQGDGLLSVQCSKGTPSALRTRGGLLCFITAKGISVVDPRRLTRNTVPPPVVIEEALIDGVETVHFSTGAQEGPVLRVPPGPRRVEFRYTGLSLEAPERVQFRLKMENFDKEWQRVGHERSASYVGLAPGHYRFRVTAANGDGVWNEEGTSLAVIIQPALWQTLWFRLVTILLGVTAVGLVYWRRLRLVEEKRATQVAFSRKIIEQQEAERKRVAAELHDSLGQNLLVIKNAAWLGADAQADNPAGKEQFQEISDLAAKAIDEVRAISHAMRPPELDSVGLSAAIRQMVKRVSETSSVQLSLENDEIDGLLPHESEIHFYRAIQEGIGNVLKHAKATTARLKIKREAGKIFVTLQDNGEGFEPGTASARRGMGLSSIAQRAQLMGGRFELKSQPGSGTTFHLSVPVHGL